MNYTILLVEDNPDDVKQTLRAFARSNIANEVVVARDGAEASDYLFGTSQTQTPGLVLLDLKLPRLTGLQVLARIREEERTKDIPVMILTSSSESQDVVASYAAGANNYLKKPVHFASFLGAARSAGLSWTLVESGLALLHPDTGANRPAPWKPQPIQPPPTEVIVGIADHILRDSVATALGSDGFAVRSAKTAQATFMALLEHLPDIAVLDVSLPEVNGIDVAHALQGRPVTAVVTSRDVIDARKRIPVGAFVCEPEVASIVSVLRHVRHLALLQALARAREAALAPAEAWSLLDLPEGASVGTVAHAMQILVNALDAASDATSAALRSRATTLAIRLRRSVAELGT